MKRKNYSQYRTKRLFFCLFILSSCVSTDSYLDMEDANSSEYSSEYKIHIINNDTIAYTHIVDNKLSNEDYKIADILENFAIKKLNEYSVCLKNNFVFSPFNASLTYSLMSNSASENEQTLIKEYIGLTDRFSIDEANQYNRKVISNIEKELDASGNELNMSNKIWVTEQSEIYRSFISILNLYNAEIEGVNFNDGRGKKTIDSYVIDNSNSDKTSLSSEYDEDMNSLFTNSVRFSMKWTNKLYIDQDTIYYSNGGGLGSIRIKVNVFGELKHTDFGFYNITEIPFEDSDYSMYIIYCPFSDSRYYNVFNDIISHGGIDKCIQDMPPTNLAFKFPSFSVDNFISLIEDKNAYLKCYSNVSPNSFILDAVSQICSIHIDENGTNAKAIMDNFKIPVTSSPQYEVLDITGPFWFIIRNNNFRYILFAGCVKDI